MTRAAATERIDPKNAIGKYVVTEGGNADIVTEADVVIKTAAPATNIPYMWNLMGKTNSNTFSHIGNAPPGTMLFLGAGVTGELVGRKYWALNYLFKYRPRVKDDDGKLVTAFRTGVTEDHYLKESIQLPSKTIDANGKLTAVGLWRKLTIVGWYMDKADAKNSLAAPEKADFTSLNGQLEWRRDISC